MKKISLLALFIIGLVASPLHAQVDTLWSTHYGEADTSEYVYSAVEGLDGEILFTGYRYDGTSNDFWVNKTDSVGNSLWTKQYGDYNGTQNETGIKIIGDNDGNYLIGGGTNSTTLSTQIYLVKINSDGDTLWTGSYGSAKQENFRSMTLLPNGNYVISGLYYDSARSSDGYDAFIMIISADGDSLDFKNYDLSIDDTYESFQDITIDENGNIIAVGLFYYWDTALGDYLWARIDPNTLNINEEVINGGDFDWATAVTRMSDNGYTIVGFSDKTASNYDYWVVRTDENADTLWTKTYGKTSSDYPDGVVETPNGGVLVSGFVYNSGTGFNEPTYVKYNSSGKLEGVRNYAVSRYYDFSYRGGNTLLRNNSDNYTHLFSFYNSTSYDAQIYRFDRGDFLALEAIYNELDGTNWTTQDNWMSDELYDDWFGITTSNGRVSEIILPDNQMNGDLPIELGDLRFLQNIDISDNSISGTFDQFLDVTTLVNVNLNNNSISGSIPVPIGGATGMQTLRATNNALSGTLPAAMGNLSGLTVLDLSGNDITGSIPNAFDGLTNLDTLNLSNNNLSAKIPGALGSLTNLRYMDLSFNALPDTVPSAFKNLSSIEEIRLNNNQLSGEVPSDLTDLTTLDRLYLNSNQLVDLPNLSSMTWISQFDVSDNLLTFEDLEPNVGITGFTYSPQDSVGQEENMVVSLGGTLELEVTIAGGSNTYQWYKDGEAITGQTSNTLSVGNVSADDAGVYHCAVSNGVATDLTIYSQPANVEVYATSYNLSNNFSFPEKGSPNDYTPNDYRLIGLPGNGNTALGNIFTGESGSDWVAYWDNGDPSTDPNVYLEKFDGSSKFNLTLGKAFWIINKGGVDMTNVQVATAPLDGNNMATVPLSNQGWVLITNPFTVPVSWSAVQAANGSISQPIYTHTGSQSSTMQPYTGYYFDNTGGLANLKIPYPGTGKVSASLATAPVESWKINIAISKNEYTDNSSAFGISELAKPKHDDLDFRKPRTVGSWPSVYFDRTEWEDGYPIYATDMRPPGTGDYRWDFNVVTGPPDVSGRQHEVVLDFQGIESVPEGVDVYLVDNVRFTQVNLKDEPVYSFMPDAKVEQFQIMVGNPDAVQQQIADALPTEFAFQNNYPNPFNPSNPMHRFTTIPVLIPEQAKLRIDIYNLRGQLIRTLFEGNVDAGLKNLEWDGTDLNNQRVASGVYICRMQNESGVRESHKILVMK